MIASSTTRPIASTRPSSVSELIEKPNAAITANVPTIDTGIATIGINVARQSFKKRKITTSTRIAASISVFTSSCSDASTNVVVSYATSRSMPGGIIGARRSSSSRTCCATSNALASGNW